MFSSDFLLDYLATLLAPIFLDATGNDAVLACAAARQTITDYRARTGAELLLVAQIIALSVASISAAVKSVQEDIPSSVSQRLQTRATTLSRAADRARNALDASMHHLPTSTDNMIPDDCIATDSVTIQPAPTDLREPVISTADVRGPAKHPANTQPPGISPAIWADSFADVAQEVAASLSSLPPRERQIASIQIAALEEAARSLNPTLSDR